MGANAQTSVPSFVSGQVLTAVDVTQINTGIPVFSGTATRDAAFGGTGEKTLAEGQMAYIEPLNLMQFHDGSTWQTMGPAGQVLVASASFSAVTTVNVDNCFTSAYRNYRLDFHLTAAAGGAQEGQVLLRVGAGNETTGYYYVRSGYSYAGVVQAEVGANSTRWFIGRSNGSASADGENAFSITLFSPALAVRTWYVGSAADGSYAANVGGYQHSELAYDGFAVTYGNESITGTYRVYGLKDTI